MKDADRSGMANSRPDLHLQIVYRRIDELRLDPKNPRKHSRKQIGNSPLDRDLRLHRPGLVDTAGNVIAGMVGSSLVAKLGRSEIPTIPIDGLTKRNAEPDDRRQPARENAEWNERLSPSS